MENLHALRKVLKQKKNPTYKYIDQILKKNDKNLPFADLVRSSETKIIRLDLFFCIEKVPEETANVISALRSCPILNEEQRMSCIENFKNESSQLETMSVLDRNLKIIQLVVSSTTEKALVEQQHVATSSPVAAPGFGNLLNLLPNMGETMEQLAKKFDGSDLSSENINHMGEEVLSSVFDAMGIQIGDSLKQKMLSMVENLVDMASGDDEIKSKIENGDISGVMDNLDITSSDIMGQISGIDTEKFLSFKKNAEKIQELE